MSPVLYFLEKVLRMGTGSLYETSRGSRAMSLKNAAHFSQFPLAELALLAERLLTMSSSAVWKLLQIQVQSAGSTVVMSASVGRLCTCDILVRRW